MKGIKQIIVRVSDEVHQKLKSKSIEEGISIQELLSNYIYSYINEYEVPKKSKSYIIENESTKQSIVLTKPELEYLKFMLDKMMEESDEEE
nr:MAG TPA: hypothetical protein [Caudoviricetes sp.]